MINFHSIDEQEIIDDLSSHDKNGLKQEVVQRNKDKYGINELSVQKQTSKFVLFLRQFNQPLVYILIVATLVTAALQEWIDSLVIFGVVLINSIIGYIQEKKAIEAIEALKRLSQTKVNVIREGKKLSIDAKELVVGDLVELYMGDKVPADIRILQSKELQSDESSLTGESLSVNKEPATLNEKTVLADRANMLYSSTLITSGSTRGIVVSVGNDTQIGKINTMISEADILQTPLTIKIAEFSKVLLYVILALAAFTFIAGVIQGEDIVEMFLAAVALCVAAIPEGLPAAMTIILAIGVSKMAKQNAIIRKLPAVETLGSTTVICSDKTGTLTQNAMTVKKIFAANYVYEVEGVGYDAQGKILSHSLSYSDNEAFIQTLRCGLLCNISQIVNENGKYNIIGDPTEAALLVSAQKADIKEEDKASYNLIDSLDFNSKNQYMATYYEKEGEHFIYLKGSIEKVLERCEYILNEKGEKVAIDKEKIIKEAEIFAADGLRVLSFAYKELEQPQVNLTHEDVKEDMVFLGLQAMIDPPRNGVKESIKDCYKAGISVKMITGDHRITALAIARDIGLKIDNEIKSLSGKELEVISDEELLAVIDTVNVYARVTPEQKLRLVKLLQNKNHIVAMTGDGVNDAPALKQANIGTAMGITGTEVSKEAADMILTDDNFITIKNAIEEGRGVYINIIKFITWVLPTNVGEGLIILCAVLFGFALPLSPVQILWVNMTTAVLLGLALAFEPKEQGLMDKPPREPNAPILSKILIIRIFYVGALLLIFSFFSFFYVRHEMGMSLEQARTVAVNVLVFGELFYLFSCRSLKDSMFKIGLFTNKWLILGVVLMVLLQLLFTYIPFMNLLFSTAPIGLTEWIFVLCSSVIIYTMVEVEKKFRKF